MWTKWGVLYISLREMGDLTLDSLITFITLLCAMGLRWKPFPGVLFDAK